MRKTAFLFPGQGAQALGMGIENAKTLPAARSLFEQAAEILGYDLLALCADGPAEKLNSTVHSQPALFVCSLAALEKLKHEQPQAAEQSVYAAGLSLGEYTALVSAGALDFASGLRLVQIRGQAMQAASDAVSSGMVSILGLQREQIEELCQAHRDDEVLQIANLLCPGNIVVSGHVAACQRVAAAAEAAGAMRTIPLSVAGAFHTPLMQSAVDRLSDALATTELRVARLPVVSNVDARPHTSPDEIRELLKRQIVAPVLWEDSLRWLLGPGGVENCFEIGPGNVLRGLLKRIDRKFPCESYE